MKLKLKLDPSILNQVHQAPETTREFGSDLTNRSKDKDYIKKKYSQGITDYSNNKVCLNIL
jgi:hypothetical protein